MQLKKIRPTYPKEFSIGLLLLVFLVACFLSHQLFLVPFNELNENIGIYLGMVLVGIAVVITILVMWEEFLFPIKVKVIQGGMIYRNHRSKLLVQLLIYCSIPAIFGFIYFTYEVNQLRFIIWTSLCTLLPLIAKIGPGINNYNDFLKLTEDGIAYKNNAKEGSFKISDIQHISIIEDKGKAVPKIQLLLSNQGPLTIDLDEMELDAFYDSIFKYIAEHYGHLKRLS